MRGFKSCQNYPMASSPVELSIRHSRRARRLILQAVPPRTVELVVPRGVGAASVDRFVREHQAWITRAGAELVAAYPDAGLQPESIEMAATGEQFRLRYETVAEGSGRLRQHGKELHLCGSSLSDWHRLLRRWLLAHGKVILTPWLQREAERTQLLPRRVQIRLQKTRWGSCSARGGISLNAALLFVPPELVRYLCVHELCHLKHLNHSRQYWQRVARHEPDYRALDQRLAACWRELPPWLLALT